MTDVPLSSYTFLITILIVAILVGFFIVKNLVKLVINSILGLILLFFVNYFDVLGLVGKPDIPITPLTFLVCVFGGVPGALILILLQLAGFPL